LLFFITALVLYHKLKQISIGFQKII